MRTINAPGIEINEIDRSYYNIAETMPSAPVTFAMGFANKGDDCVPRYVYSMTDFINTYGSPENEAERYFYYAAKDTFDNGGMFMGAKLPYNNDMAKQYKCLRYRVDDVTSNPQLNINTDLSVTNINNYRKISLWSNTTNPSEKKSIISIDIDQLDAFQTKSTTVENNYFYIVDISKQKYIKDQFITNNTFIENNGNEYIGLVPVLVSAPNAIFFQNLISSDYQNPISAITFAKKSSGTDYEPTENPESDPVLNNLYITLADNDINIETVSKIATEFFPKIVYKTPDTFDKEYLKNIGIVIFMMKQEAGNNGKISLIPVESFVGSFDKKAVDKTTGLPMFIDDIVNSNSHFINIFSNVKNADKNDFDTYLIANSRAVSIGFRSDETAPDISSTEILDAIDTILAKLENKESARIDVLVDAGISTIAQFINDIEEYKTSSHNDIKVQFDPDIDSLLENIVGLADFDNIAEDLSNCVNTMSSNKLNVWRNILNKYKTFCEVTRKDCMFIADGPRKLCLVGKFPVIRKLQRKTSVKNTILPNIRYLTGIDTSYGAGYLDWFMCYDELRKTFIWLPPTIKMGGIYTRLDITGNIWEAPAGMNNGKFVGVYDLAFNPTNTEAGTIYLQNWNYAMSYPTTGTVPEGQKTFQRKKSAFDRINVRRLFLGIERTIGDISRTFLYENISDYQIEKFRTTCIEVLQRTQNVGGLQEFAIICDSRNNTAQTIDNNELHCTIGIKPYKAAEFIVLNFLCTSQGANVEEVVTDYLFNS